MTRRGTQTPEIAVLLRTDATTGDFLRQGLTPGLAIERLYDHVRAGLVRQAVSVISPAGSGRVVENVAQLAWLLETVLSEREGDHRVLNVVVAVPDTRQRTLVKTVLAPLRKRRGVSIFYAPSIANLLNIAKVDVMTLRFSAGGEPEQEPS